MNDIEWAQFWGGLTESQRDEIRAKARWEHMTLRAVAEQWFREWIDAAREDSK